MGVLITCEIEYVVIAGLHFLKKNPTRKEERLADGVIENPNSGLSNAFTRERFRSIEDVALGGHDGNTLALVR